VKIEVKITKSFKRQAKPLLKKYISLKNELLELQSSLFEHPEQGILLTENVFKIKIGVKSKGRGKSGGLRIITFVETFIVAEIEEDDKTKKTVNLIAIYDKSETENIHDSEIENLISEIDFE
jgi:mRNA-degrading endonuclease RelE of RelBE toxin-antitoxin system